MRNSNVCLAVLVLSLTTGFERSADAQAPSADSVRVVRDVAYKRGATSPSEHQRCKLDWYLPASKPAGFPTIVWFHGGGLRNGDKGDAIASALGRRFARQGIAVASVNYRLSPKVEYPAYTEDAAAAVAYVCTNVGELGGRSGQVFVSGHSAGGYLTAMVGLHPDLLKVHGITRNSLAGFIPVSGQMITHSTVREERGIPRSRPIIDEAAPAYYATSQSPPFLCIVAGNDLPARAEENHYFVAAMQAAGHKSIRVVEFAGRDHATIANQMGNRDDEVAASITAFIAEAVSTRSEFPK